MLWMGHVLQTHIIQDLGNFMEWVLKTIRTKNMEENCAIVLSELDMTAVQNSLPQLWLLAWHNKKKPIKMLAWMQEGLQSSQAQQRNYWQLVTPSCHRLSMTHWITPHTNSSEYRVKNKYSEMQCFKSYFNSYLWTWLHLHQWM